MRGEQQAIYHYTAILQEQEAIFHFSFLLLVTTDQNLLKITVPSNPSA